MACPLFQASYTGDASAAHMHNRQTWVDASRAVVERAGGHLKSAHCRRPGVLAGGATKGPSMIPKHPLFEQHWHEFTAEHPEMLPRGRYVLEADREEPELSVDLIAFMHFVRWAKQKGYGPVGVTGLIPWVKATYRPMQEEQGKPDASQP
jgi:hypothetical protein